MRVQLSAALLFCAAGITAAWAAGVDLDHLGRLSAAAAIASGAVAIAGAVAVVAGSGRLRRKIGLGAIWAVGFLGVGLAAFDNRAAAQLVDLPSALEPSLTRYCPPPSTREPPPPPPPKKVAQAQGCALIIRAYELGYAKSLGSCAPEEVEQVIEQAEAPTVEPCRDRRSGEPLFHYGWRVLDRSLHAAGEVAGSGLVSSAIDETRIRLDYVKPLADTQWQAIASSPHSSHHLFTNLPAPRERGWLDRSSQCSGPARELEARLDFDSPSALVEHAYAIMLFDPRFGEPVGSCREHTIHWGQDPEICARMRDHPAAALDDAGVLDDVEATLARLRDALELAELAGKLGKRGDTRLPDAREIASVHCLIVGAEPGFTRAEVELGGSAIEVAELRVKELSATGPAQLEAYQELAQVLSGERYAGPLESDATAAAPPAAGFLDGDGFALARAEVLRDGDPFVDPINAAVLDRPSVGDIYPLAIHLSQLVAVFRRSYRKQRRRL